MTIIIQTHELRARLSEALRRVEQGHTVSVTRHGRTIALIRPTGIDWGGLSVRPAKNPHPRKIRPFKGSGTLSRQIVEDRRRRERKILGHKRAR